MTDAHGAPVKAKVITRDFADSKASYNLYIMFKAKEAVEQALQLNGSELLGRHLRIDRVGGRSGGSQGGAKEHDY